jgi:hypothetical protein
VQISALRERVSRELREFAWNEWAQMGILADVRRQSPWVADPEAHFLFTLQVGRDDPRLFDETLDWLAANSELVSAQRLRNMAGSPDDARLAEAAIAWVSRQGGRSRGFVPKPQPVPPVPEPLFYGSRKPAREDESFAGFGFLRSPANPSGKSRRPDVRIPVNFAFRLRDVFGVGSRAEVVRFLLTASRHASSTKQPRFSTPAIADAAGFAKRNVHEVLVALAEAGSVEMSVRGREHFYAIDAEAWAAALGVDDGIPIYRDWTHVLLGVRELHRWLASGDADKLTPYMRASEARLLVDQIESTFRHAGMPVAQRGLPAEGEDYWPVFVDFVDQVLTWLPNEQPW